MKATFDVGTVTQAMRGRNALARRGITAYVKRRTDHSDTGCGYLLTVEQKAENAAQILRQAGVSFERLS